MESVSLQCVLNLHEAAIKEFGGLLGILDYNRLVAAVERPHSGFGDVELFPTVFLKAAAVAHGIDRGHPFVDGNK